MIFNFYNPLDRGDNEYKCQVSTSKQDAYDYSFEIKIEDIVSPQNYINFNNIDIKVNDGFGNDLSSQFDVVNIDESVYKLIPNENFKCYKDQNYFLSIGCGEIILYLQQLQFYDYKEYSISIEEANGYSPVECIVKTDSQASLDINNVFLYDLSTGEYLNSQFYEISDFIKNDNNQYSFNINLSESYGKFDEVQKFEICVGHNSINLGSGSWHVNPSLPTIDFHTTNSNELNYFQIPITIDNFKEGSTECSLNDIDFIVKDENDFTLPNGSYKVVNNDDSYYIEFDNDYLLRYLNESQKITIEARWNNYFLNSFDFEFISYENFFEISEIKKLSSNRYSFELLTSGYNDFNSSKLSIKLMQDDQEVDKDLYSYTITNNHVQLITSLTNNFDIVIYQNNCIINSCTVYANSNDIEANIKATNKVVNHDSADIVFTSYHSTKDFSSELELRFFYHSEDWTEKFEYFQTDNMSFSFSFKKSYFNDTNRTITVKLMVKEEKNNSVELHEICKTSFTLSHSLENATADAYWSDTSGYNKTIIYVDNFECNSNNVSNDDLSLKLYIDNIDATKFFSVEYTVVTSQYSYFEVNLNKGYIFNSDLNVNFRIMAKNSLIYNGNFKINWIDVSANFETNEYFINGYEEFEIPLSGIDYGTTGFTNENLVLDFANEQYNLNQNFNYHISDNIIYCNLHDWCFIDSMTINLQIKINSIVLANLILNFIPVTPSLTFNVSEQYDVQYDVLIPFEINDYGTYHPNLTEISQIKISIPKFIGLDEFYENLIYDTDFTFEVNEISKNIKIDFLNTSFVDDGINANICFYVTDTAYNNQKNIFQIETKLYESDFIDIRNEVIIHSFGPGMSIQDCFEIINHNSSAEYLVYVAEMYAAKFIFGDENAYDRIYVEDDMFSVPHYIDWSYNGEHSPNNDEHYLPLNNDILFLLMSSSIGYWRTPEYLNISGNEIYQNNFNVFDFSMENIKASQPRPIDKFIANYCNISELYNFVSLSYSQANKSYDFSHNHISKIDNNILYDEWDDYGNEKINELNLSFNNLNIQSFDNFNFSFDGRDLEINKINLSNNEVGLINFDNYGISSNKIKSINLSHNNIGIVSDWSYFDNLIEIDLSYTNICADAMLYSGNAFANLKTLNISGNKLTYESNGILNINQDLTNLIADDIEGLNEVIFSHPFELKELSFNNCSNLEFISFPYIEWTPYYVMDYDTAKKHSDNQEIIRLNDNYFFKDFNEYEDYWHENGGWNSSLPIHYYDLIKNPWNYLTLTGEIKTSHEEYTWESHNCVDGTVNFVTNTVEISHTQSLLINLPNLKSIFINNTNLQPKELATQWASTTANSESIVINNGESYHKWVTKPNFNGQEIDYETLSIHDMTYRIGYCFNNLLDLEWTNSHGFDYYEINSNYFGQEATANLPFATFFPSLNYINLSNMKIYSLDFLNNLSNLSMLILDNCSLTDEITTFDPTINIDKNVDWNSLSNLRFLSIKDNEISFAGLDSLTNLVEVDISNNMVEKTASFTSKYLTYINISNNTNLLRIEAQYSLYLSVIFCENCTKLGSEIDITKNRAAIVLNQAVYDRALEDIDDDYTIMPIKIYGYNTSLNFNSTISYIDNLSGLEEYSSQEWFEKNVILYSFYND